MAQTPRLMYNYRGVYHRDLTHEVAYYAGRFTGEYYRERSGKANPSVFVANDHRFSSNSLKHYVSKGLIDAGCHVSDIGCLPTSVASYAIRKHADGGVVVTASHNPPEHNGLKFFDATGGVLKPATEESLIARVLEQVRQDDSVPERRITDSYTLVGPDEVIADYVADVGESIALAQPLDVAVDCRYGTAFLVMPALLDRLQCRYRMIHDQLHPYFLKPNGVYLNPEPKEDNIEDIREFVRQGSFDVGLIFDGDSDRNVIVDNEGNHIPDDTVLLLLAMEYADRATPVAITVDTSLMTERQLRQEGLDILVTPVGDPFIAHALETTNASFGGVPNGHYIFPGFNLYSDGIYSAAVMLRLTARLKQRGTTLAGFLRTLPATHLLKVKHPYGRTRREFQELVAPRLRDLMAAHCECVDYLETDDCVVTGKTDATKMLVRYNRWDNNFNVQAESLRSAEEASSLLQSLLHVLETTRQ